MKIYIENLKPNMSPYNGKGKFIKRLAKQFRKMPEIEIVDKPKDCDINFAMNHLPKTDYGKRVVRLDGYNFTLSKPEDILKDRRDFETTFEKADGLVFQSNVAETNLIKYVDSEDIPESLIEEKSIIIPNGVDPEEFKPKTGYFVFAHQVMHEIRNLDLLLEAWGMFVKDYPGFWLHIYYDPKRSTINYEKIPFVPNAVYKYFIEDDKLIPVLQDAKAVINLTENDACPNLLIEAMACGTSIIALESNGIWYYADNNKDNRIELKRDSLYSAMKRMIVPNLIYWLNIKHVANRYVEFFKGLL